jgi:hypothetical protein
MEIRFGIYLSLVGSIIVSLYGFLRVQQKQKRDVQELFHQAPQPSREPHASADSSDQTPHLF